MIDWSVAVELLISKVLNYATSFLFPWRHILEYTFEKDITSVNFHDTLKYGVMITTANQNKGKYHREPVRTWDKKKNSGKRAWC